MESLWKRFRNPRSRKCHVIIIKFTATFQAFTLHPPNIKILEPPRAYAIDAKEKVSFTKMFKFSSSLKLGFISFSSATPKIDRCACWIGWASNARFFAAFSHYNFPRNFHRFSPFSFYVTIIFLCISCLVQIQDVAFRMWDGCFGLKIDFSTSSWKSWTFAWK